MRGLPAAVAHGTVVYEIDQPDVIDVQDSDDGRLGAEPTATRRDRRRSICVRTGPRRCRPRDSTIPGPPPGGRGTADLPAARSPGPAVRRRSRRSAPGSTVATEYVPGILDFDADKAREMSAPLREHGLDIDMPSLVYAGERSHVMEYLGQNGWQVTGSPRDELFVRIRPGRPDRSGQRSARRDRLRQRAHPRPDDLRRV